MMRRCFRHVFGLAPVLATSLLTTPSSWADGLNGQQVFDSVCSNCHRTGVAGAPRMGDETSWQAFEAEGQATVTAHGWVGVRGMPPRGGKADLPLREFAGAVAYMASRSGIDWQEPDAAMMESIETEIVKRQAELAANKGEQP